MAVMGTELLYLRDAYLLTVEANVTDVDVEGRRIVLDRTVFYPTGGGQPYDTGELAGLPVSEVRKEGELVWHTLAGVDALPAVGDTVRGTVDWERRHALMRTYQGVTLGAKSFRSTRRDGRSRASTGTRSSRTT